MSKLKLLMLGILGTGALCAGCGDDDGDGDGEAKTYDITLTTAAEKPAPCGMAGASATGTAKVTISADGATVTVSDLQFTGLSGNNTATAAHIHYEGGMNPAVFNLGTSLAPPVSGTFTAANYPASPAPPIPSTYAAFITDMKAGKTYLNVHTGACMGGEILGQIQ